MMGQKGPELTSSPEHPQITIICRKTIHEKDQNLKKRSSPTKNIEKEPWCDRHHSETYTPRWATHRLQLLPPE